MLCYSENKSVTSTNHTWQIIEHTSKNLVGSKPPSRLFSYLWCVIIAFYSLSSEKQISEKYQKIHEQKTENTFLGLKPPSRLYFWLLYMICDHCILFLFRQKQILVNSGRTDKTFGNTRKPIFRLETTLEPDVANSNARVYTDQKINTHAFFFLIKKYMNKSKQIKIYTEQIV